MGIKTIAEFDRELQGGLQPNRYKVLLTLPSGVQGDVRTLSLMVKASNLPAMETGIIEVNKSGQMIKLSGDKRPSGEWTCTAYLNRSGTIAQAKKIAEQWQELAFNRKNPTEYKSSAIIEVYTPDEDEEVALKYLVEGIWCNTTGDLSLGDDNVDTLLEFDLVLQFDRVKPLH